MLLFEAAIAAANGLGTEPALRAITISPARILGIDDKAGSLTKGKDADFVASEGDPFEYTSHVQEVLVEGVGVEKLDAGRGILMRFPWQ